MFVKLGLFLLVCLGLLVATAPASLLDIGLAAATGDVVRLGSSEGTLWRGRGMLVVRDAGGASAKPWLPLVWHLDRAALLHGELTWASEPGSGLRGEISLGGGGFRLHEVALRAPASVVFALLPGTLAHFGWGGEMSLQAPSWHCSSDHACDGELRLQWRGASSALLPLQRLGDYEIQAHGNGRSIDFAVRTLAGEINVAGNGSFAAGAPPTFQGRISSPPDALRTLPNIAGGAILAEGAPGNYVVRYPVQR